MTFLPSPLLEDTILGIFELNAKTCWLIVASLIGGIEATNKLVLGNRLVIWSISALSRAGAALTSKLSSMSFVPIIKVIMSGRCVFSHPLIELAISSILQPECPSLSLSPRLLGPLDKEPTKSTLRLLALKLFQRVVRYPPGICAPSVIESPTGNIFSVIVKVSVVAFLRHIYRTTLIYQLKKKVSTF